MSRRTPRDLAHYVYGRLDLEGVQSTVDIFDDLFHTLFLTSLKTEEGVSISCAIAYADPSKPDVDPPKRLRDQYWRLSLFEKPRPYNVSELAKLALATDPTISSLAVYPDKSGSLKIWGIFDQQGGFQSFIRHERGTSFGPPGVLQAQIVSQGHIVVAVGLSIVAELNGGTLVEQAIDIFQGSLIVNKLKAGIERRTKNIATQIKREECKPNLNYGFEVPGMWVSTLCRILLRARALGHGGAFLITDAPKQECLDVKYKIKYSRVAELFENWLSWAYVHGYSYDVLAEQVTKNDGIAGQQEVWSHIVAHDQEKDAWEGLTGAVAFVAALARVDGLVLMDSDLVVHGFGCEITSAGGNDFEVYRTEHPTPTKGRPTKWDQKRFGTRHRSMARYCSVDRAAVGFVLSHDGPVRAFTGTGKNVYTWENVQLGISEPLRES